MSARPFGALTAELLGVRMLSAGWPTARPYLSIHTKDVVFPTATPTAQAKRRPEIALVWPGEQVASSLRPTSVFHVRPNESDGHKY